MSINPLLLSLALGLVAGSSLHAGRTLFILENQSDSVWSLSDGTPAFPGAAPVLRFESGEEGQAPAYRPEFAGEGWGLPPHTKLTFASPRPAGSPFRARASWPP